MRSLQNNKQKKCEMCGKEATLEFTIGEKRYSACDECFKLWDSARIQANLDYLALCGERGLYRDEKTGFWVMNGGECMEVPEMPKFPL